MNLGVGEGKGKTREDHKQVSDQMYANYAEGRDLRGLVAIVGEEALSDRDRKLLRFAEDFENQFVKQSRTEDRTISQTLNLGWKLLGRFEKRELTRISTQLKEKYHKESKEEK